MKKVLKKINALKFMSLFAMLILFSSCNDDDDNHEYHYEYVNVTSVEVADEFTYGKIHQVDVTIELPSSCYYFYNQYEYKYEGTSRLIYPISHVDDNEACLPNVTTATFSIPVEVLQRETYIFKFYQGEDADGEDTFLTIEVPVN